MIDREHFFAVYRADYGALGQPLVDAMSFLLNRMESDEAITDQRWIAYIMATIRHETAGTFLPIMERGPVSYFDKYDAGTARGERLGNTMVGDGYRFRGRGYVQITGRANMAKLGHEVEQDLVTFPDLALVPPVAYAIMSVGMTRGLFTGKKLADYISGKKCDWYNARKIINGTDRASVIAMYATTFASGLGIAA